MFILGNKMRIFMLLRFLAYKNAFAINLDNTKSSVLLKRVNVALYLYGYLQIFFKFNIKF